MPWFKASDDLWCDPEMMGLSDGALALWLKAGTYCAGKLTDGFLPQEALRFMQTRKRYVDELVSKGIWERHESGSPLAVHWQSAGGWLAVSWQENARSRVDVLAERSETKQRVRAHRNNVTPPVSNGPPVPGPVPDPIPEPEEKGACEVRPVVRVAPKPANQPATYARVWQAYANAVGLDPLQLGSPKFDACRAIEAAATAEAGSSTGPKFDAALTRLMSAWRADPWVQQQNPSLAHLASNLAKYAPGVKPAAAKPAIPAKEQLAEARERTLDLQRLVNRLESAPWHDRKYIGRDGLEHDRKLHVECLEKANQDLKAAQQAEHALRVQLREAS